MSISNIGKAEESWSCFIRTFLARSYSYSDDTSSQPLLDAPDEDRDGDGDGGGADANNDDIGRIL